MWCSGTFVACVRLPGKQCAGGWRLAALGAPARLLTLRLRQPSLAPSHPTLLPRAELAEDPELGQPLRHVPSNHNMRPRNILVITSTGAPQDIELSHRYGRQGCGAPSSVVRVGGAGGPRPAPLPTAQCTPLPRPVPQGRQPQQALRPPLQQLLCAGGGSGSSQPGPSAARELTAGLGRCRRRRSGGAGLRKGPRTGAAGRAFPAAVRGAACCGASTSGRDSQSLLFTLRTVKKACQQSQAGSSPPPSGST